jgi:glycine/D-amino acid oxidase-like deaminating enzyme/nitrite reductase/ring-hydroxylating ferredoxin subunit
MEHGSGTTKSIWMDELPLRPVHRLPRRSVVDVCVVGGGLAGITTAYLLSQAGRKVVLLEDGTIGSGETSRTTAHLTSAMDDRITKLEDWHGSDKAHIITQSHQTAINKIEEIVRTERIDCGFKRVPGYLFVQEGRTLTELTKEQRAAQRAGLSVRRVPHAPWKAFDTGPAVRFDNQGMFHPLRYLHALADRIEARGGIIYEHVHVSSVEEGRPVRITTAEGKVVRARDLVIATNSPITDFFAIHTKQKAMRTYAIAATIPRGYVPPGLYWDTGSPYHYIRTFERGGKTYLIVGAEDAPTGMHDDERERLKTVERWTRDRFPKLGRVEYRWSGQVFEPLDGAAFIGPDPSLGEHVWVITGDSGQGMTHTTLGAMILADLVMGIQNPWAEAYDPSRKMGKQTARYVKGSTKRNLQYLKHLIPGADDPTKIEIGEGQVIKRGFKQFAVYRESADEYYAMSAACAHMGCPVQWNGLEKSWDCTCHGSRYDPKGGVLCGPANDGLKPVDSKVATERPVPRRRSPPSPATARRRAGIRKRRSSREKTQRLLK